MTRAVVVAAERSRGGLNGWTVEVGEKREFGFFHSPVEAIALADVEMKRAGISADERARVVGLLSREVNRLRRAEVTAEMEVPRG